MTKKLLPVLVLAFLASCATPITPDDYDSANTRTFKSSLEQSRLNDDVLYSDYQKDGIEYRVYTSHPYGGLVVVNQTKEKLEVELLRKQLQAK